ncbi:hypothetical protein [Chryseobacterium sp.]|uniref:hypothetical protein n=1 Tax=Chryseobacterium sp. TaxID=1871047 RepID=UPI0035C6D7D9
MKKLYEITTTTVMGESIVVMAEESKLQIFNDYKKLIDFTIALEIEILSDEIENYSKNAIDKDDLMDYLKTFYREVNLSFVEVTEILPLQFYSNYKEGTDTETFIDFMISEVREEIDARSSIPDIDEVQILVEWKVLESLYQSRLLLKNWINEILHKSHKTFLIDNPYPQTFRDGESYLKFKNIMETLNAFDGEGNPRCRGFQAKANAIYTVDRRCDDISKKLLVPNVLLADFVNFLDTEFKLDIKYHNKFKLSSGENHEREVEKFY